MTPPTGVCIQTIWALTVTFSWCFLVLQVGLCCDAYFLVVFLPDVFLDFLKYKSRFWSSMYVCSHQSVHQKGEGWWIWVSCRCLFFSGLFFLYVDCWDCWIMPQNEILGFSIFVCFILFCLCTIGCFCFSMYYSDRI